jgi:hypothetical protein
VTDVLPTVVQLVERGGSYAVITALIYAVIYLVKRAEVREVERQKFEKDHVAEIKAIQQECAEELRVLQEARVVEMRTVTQAAISLGETAERFADLARTVPR